MQGKISVIQEKKYLVAICLKDFRERVLWLESAVFLIISQSEWLFTSL